MSTSETSPASSSWPAILRQYGRSWLDGWERFWFRPSDPATLGLIRFFAGSMLFYTHLIWGKELLQFFGPEGRLPAEFSRHFYGSDSATWSFLFWFDSQPAMLWGVHLVGLLIFLAFALGWQTRITGMLAAVITIAYANRAAGALFGLDQINGFLALYLALGPSGAAFSIDQWLRGRKGQGGGIACWISPQRTSGTTMSLRLIQVHMCIVYLFAGLGKLQGETWWNGEAFWGAVANAEYQTLDLTWLASYPWLVNLATHITIFWEVSYAALVWPPRTRPIVVLMSIPLHMGIACGMGMMTFGLIMLVGNLAFVPAWFIRKLLRLQDDSTS